MPKTRTKSAIYLVGRPKNAFSERDLPTTLELLQVYFYHKTSLPKDGSIEIVITDLVWIWEKIRIPTLLQRNIKWKIMALLAEYRKVVRNKKN